MGRFNEVGVFPYSINENGDLVILFRRNWRGPSPDLLHDFGWHINKNEPTVYFSAIRGFMSKSLGLFSHQIFDINSNPSLTETNKELISIGGITGFAPNFEGIDEPNFSEENIYHWYQSGLQELLYFTKYLVIHFICGEFLWLFFPLPSYTNLDAINKCLSNSKGYQGIEFEWIKLSDFITESIYPKDELDTDFICPSSLMSSFDFFVVWKNSSKLLDIQLKALPQEEHDDQYDDEDLLQRPKPNYGIILLESKEYWIGLYEAMIIPNLLDEGDFWELYHGFEGEYPSIDELQSLKGIVVVVGSGIGSSDQQIIFDGWKLFINMILDDVNVKREKEGIRAIKIITIGFPLGEYTKINHSMPFHIGKTKFNIWNDEFYKLSGFNDNSMMKYFYTIKMQSTVITKLPEGATNLWSSEFSEFEMFKIGDNLLSIQAHPEVHENFFNKQLIKRLYDTLVIDKEFQTEILNELYDESKPLFNDQIMLALKNFIKL